MSERKPFIHPDRIGQAGAGDRGRRGSGRGGYVDRDAPVDERDAWREREREREDRRYTRRERSRSRSPHRGSKRARARSPTPEQDPERKWKRPAPGTGKGRGHAAVADKAAAKKAAKKKAAERELTEEEKMMAAMGIPIGFDTTKGKLTDPSTNMSGARRQTKRTYRQYMNRRGGFNRPLEPEKLRK